MKILKNFLIGAGVVFLLIIALIIYLAGSSSKFLDNNEAFVKEFSHDFSQNWKVTDVSDRCTTEFLSQIHTPNGAQAIQAFKSLGKLVETSDFEMSNYNTNFNAATTGTIKFKAKFENVEAIVTVSLRVKDGAAKVLGFHVDPLTEIHKPKNIKI